MEQQPNLLAKLLIYTVHFKLTPNNCIITLQHKQKKTLTTMSIGNVGYKNTKKSSELAHLHIIHNLIKTLKLKNIKAISIFFDGLKKYRRLIITELKKENIQIRFITDQTPILHNGCKKFKKRRL